MSVYISVDLQRKIRKQFHDCCAYCRTAEFLTAMTFEFEHIQPLAVGGETVCENLCFACPSCNRHKGKRQAAPASDSGEIVPFFHPQKQSWTDHFAWSEGGCKVIGLTPIGQVTITALQMNRPALVQLRGMWVKLDEHPPTFN